MTPQMLLTLATLAVSACRDAQPTPGSATPPTPISPPPTANDARAAAAADAGPRADMNGRCELDRDCEPSLRQCADGGSALCVRPWVVQAEGGAIHALGMCQVKCGGGSSGSGR